MFGQDDVNPQEAANLNDLIYNNFMQMMGLNLSLIHISLRKGLMDSVWQKKCSRGQSVLALRQSLQKY